MKASIKNLIIGLFFIFGLIVANIFEIQTKSILIIIIFLFFVFLFFYFKKRKLIFFLLCLIFFLFGVARLNFSKINYNDNSKIWFYNNTDFESAKGKKSKFQGKIISEPDRKIDSQKIKIATSKLIESESKEISGNVLAKTDLYPPFYYGDDVEVVCSLIKPAPIEDFRYDKYLEKENIYSLCYSAQIKLLKRQSGNKIFHFIYKIKNNLFWRTSDVWPEPISSFINSMLFGFENLLPEDISENFRRTGLSHIIVVSGMHVTIIIVVFSKLLYILGSNRKKNFLIIPIVLFAFAILSGLSASIIRACVMGTLVLFGENSKRIIPKYLIIIYSLMIMLIVNPLTFFYDVGFQLSFLATIGLLYISPILQSAFKFIPERFDLRSILSTSVSAIIMTLPLSMFQFKKVPTLSLLSNILILPMIEIETFLSAAIIIISYINSALGRMLGISIYALTKIMFFIIEKIASIKFSLIDFTSFSLLSMVIAYLIIGVLYIYAKKKTDI